MTPMSWQISCSECDVGPNVDSELEKEGIVSISRELPNKQHDSVQLSSTSALSLQSKTVCSRFHYDPAFAVPTNLTFNSVC